MTIIMTINIMLSIMFLFMNHPLSLGSILLLQTITISIITGKMMINFWYSYILFLVMVGGMLILFMYMTSIASNEKFKMSNSTMFMAWSSPMIFFFLKSWILELSNKSMDSEVINKTIETSLSMTKFMQQNTYLILMFLMLYLFIALIATVKISSINQGPLRQMYN
uniref:NADH-ubiquinone oxidoreductase chain 6 n=1 Tax=Impressosora (Neoeutrapela) sp. EUT01 TaxID=1205672 RepID=A0A0S2MNZ6_9CUCU|nr:NADH deshydrogenase subunit 6 [Impressosora (Neoeutrapela) sp. EUT01]